MSIKFTTAVRSPYRPRNSLLVNSYSDCKVLFATLMVITMWERLQARCGAFSAEGLDNKGFCS